MIILTRKIQNGAATLGRLVVPSGAFWFTLENPKRPTPVDDRIPPGFYICKRVDSPKFGDTFEVTKVPGRSHILFHSGNKEKDTLGCILLGKASNSVDEIYRSRVAFREFMTYFVNVDEFPLRVEEKWIPTS